MTGEQLYVPQDDGGSRSSRFRSRFLRGDDDDEAGGYGGSSSNRKSLIDEEEGRMSKKERMKVVETEDASRGPLSGCIRLADSSRIIQRLKVSARRCPPLLPEYAKERGNKAAAARHLVCNFNKHHFLFGCRVLGGLFLCPDGTNDEGRWWVRARSICWQASTDRAAA